MENTFSDYSESSRIGAGYWYSLHFDAYYADCEEDLNALYKKIERTRTRFGCKVCANHFDILCKNSNLMLKLEKDKILLKHGQKPQHLQEFLINAHSKANTNRNERLVSKGLKPIITKEEPTLKGLNDWFMRSELTPCGKGCEESSQEKSTGQNSERKKMYRAIF